MANFPSDRKKIWLEERDKEFLVSARANLNAILDGPPPVNYGSPLWIEVTKIVQQIEKLLGY